MNTGILSAKGWVVIPQELRKRYRLKKGDKVHFVDYGGVVAIVPVAADSIKASRGMFKGNTSLTGTLLRQRKEDKKQDK